MSGAGTPLLKHRRARSLSMLDLATGADWRHNLPRADFVTSPSLPLGSLLMNSDSSTGGYDAAAKLETTDTTEISLQIRAYCMHNRSEDIQLTTV